MVVEDSPVQALNLQLLLEERGFEVSVAEDGQQAIQLLSEVCPSLIISDVLMPEIDGYGLCKYVKSNASFRDVPVLLLTQLTSPHEIIKALQAGADGFVTKPYEHEFLVECINNLMITRALRRRTTTDNRVEILFDGKTYLIDSSPLQMIDLLLSTFRNAIQKNSELEKANDELILMHDELKATNKELKKSIEEQNRFMGIAAHDLRNPLNVIMGYSDFILKHLGNISPTHLIQFITSIRERSQFMLKLVTDLLDLSKIQSGKLKLNLKSISIKALIEKNVALNLVIAENKRIQLHLHIEEGLPLLQVDPEKIEQVLNNLISNAVKYSYQDSIVHIDVQAQDQTLLIAVQDEGVGIPEEELDSLFEPFVTTSATSPEGEKSTGLGLAIVKNIVDGHGGRIWVNSSVGEGSTFFFSLPLTTKP